MPAPDFLYLPNLQDTLQDPSIAIQHQDAVTEVTVAPTALFVAIDQFLRREDPSSRVVGVLVGSRSDENNIAEIHNALPLKHSEEEDDIAFNTDYLETIVSLHQKVFPNDEVIGWYSTGSEIVSTSAYIHDFFTSNYTNPVHLLIDTSLPDDDFSTRAFISNSLGVPGSDYEGYIFNELPCTVIYDETDRVGLNLMLEYADAHENSSTNAAQQQKLISSAAKAAASNIAATSASANESSNTIEAAKKATQEFAENASALLSDMGNLEHVITQIRNLLGYVTKYVEDVNNGKIEADPSIGEILMETVTLAPKMDPEEFTKLFNNHLQDLLMVVYLGNLTKLKSIHS